MRIVGGVWGGRKLHAPTGSRTRPTTDRVREAWMSAISGELKDAHILDLFAGSGALGIEALSRGAAHVTFVESEGSVVAVLRKNLLAIQIPEDRYRVVRGDVFTALDRLGNGFDVALADPPYASGLAARLATRFQAVPFADLLCLEHGAREVLDADPVRERRYGDTVLTFLRAPDLRAQDDEH